MLSKWALLMLFTLLEALTLQAAEPLIHVTPEPLWLSNYKPYDKKPSMRLVEDGYFFALAEHQTQVEMQADYHHFIREIVSASGIQNGSEISVSFDPSYERLDFHEIVVWRNNKPLNRLKPGAFKIIADEHDLSNFIYQGTYSALYILDDVRKGDRIEYSYTLTGRNPIFNNRYCDNIYLQWFQTVAHEFNVVIASSQRNLHLKYFNSAVKPVVIQANGLTRYEWENFMVKPALYDDAQPQWYESRAYVQISDYDSWAQVTDWALSINMAKTNITGELADEIRRLKKEAGGSKEKYFRGAVKTVQDEVRYMGIEIGQYSHRANDPEKVFDQRYGDCKDKSLLLVSMLRAYGIEAYMVLVNPDLGNRIAQFLPAHNVFNHAVVMANINNKRVWVDATINYQRGAGTDLYFPDYGKGLILKPGTVELADIPATRVGKIICEENYTIKDEKSPVELLVKTTYTLNQADRIRDRLASSGIAGTEKSYLKYYSRIYSQIDEKDSVIVNDDEQRNKLTTIEKYVITDFFKHDTTTDAYSVDFYADYIKEQFPSFTNQTKVPVDVNYPFSEDYTINVTFPFEWSVNERSDEIKRNAYEFSSRYTSSGKTLSLNYKFAYLKEYVPLDEVKQFKKDIKRLADNGLSYQVNYSRPDDGGSDANQWMINLSLIIVSGFGIAAFSIYRTHTPGIVFSYGSTFTPIGGWLIFILLILVLTPVESLIYLINDNCFSISKWNSYEPAGNAMAQRSLLIIKTSGGVFTVCYSTFSLILLINKRDIFPKYIIGFFVFRAFSYLFDFSFSAIVLHRQITNHQLVSGLSNIIFALIWVPYFMQSERVEETFIVPYPPENYRYDPRPGPSNLNES